MEIREEIILSKAIKKTDNISLVIGFLFCSKKNYFVSGFLSMISSSKTKVALGGITLPAPLSP